MANVAARFAVIVGLAAAHVAGCGGTTDVADDADTNEAAIAEQSLSPADNLHFCAHQDDDLLFMSGAITRELARGERVTIVYYTAGAMDGDYKYADQREQGIRAAYQFLLDLKWSDWKTSSLPVRFSASKRASFHMLTETKHNQLRLIFLRRPNGDQGGAKQTSIGDVWQGKQKSVESLYPNDGPSLTRVNLVQLTQLLYQQVQPKAVHTLDPTNIIYDAWDDHYDHYDHQHAARFAREAFLNVYKGSAKPPAYFMYRGYNIEGEPINVTGAEYTRKMTAFKDKYGPHDNALCEAPLTTQCVDDPNGIWLDWTNREYGVPCDQLTTKWAVPGCTLPTR